MHNRNVLVAGGVVVGLVLGLVIAKGGFFGVRNGGIGMMGSNQYTGEAHMMGNIDEHFIEQMIPHHDGAIAMANLALKKGTRPQIKNLAEAIVRDQSKEIETMRSWYRDWFRTEVSKVSSSMMEGGMMAETGMHMGGRGDMQTLENAPDFDKAFIEAMIPHHQMAVMMARMLKSGTTRPEMVSLADAIIESQSREIQDMQSWYESWY